jgi:hypothetical protein
MLLLAALLQTAAPCPAVPVAPPAELAGWTRKAPITATPWGERAVPVRGPAKGKLLPATLTVGEGASAALSPIAIVRFPVTPGKPAAAGSHGGVLRVVIPAAGRYRVAAGAAAWLDVVRDGAALTSVTHGHGPACTGIRKYVDFDLKPGAYLLQMSGSPAPTLDVMVARLP